MLDWLFIMLLVIGILFILLSIEFDLGLFWNVIIILTSIIIFFVLAASVKEIEIPYQMYNATSGNIETGHHTYSSSISPYLSYLFMMFGSIMMIYFVATIYIYIGKKSWIK